MGEKGYSRNLVSSMRVMQNIVGMAYLLNHNFNGYFTHIITSITYDY